MEKQKNTKESILYHPEPWEKWESQLVLGSILSAIIGLIILAILINTFILK